jgi:hypothetical protein
MAEVKYTGAVSAEENGIRVELEWIGEGNCGDYNEDDPEDEPLLRFTFLEFKDGDWQQIDDCSYCTQLRADLPDNLKIKALQVLLANFPNFGRKKVCERLSWIKVEDLK